MDLADSSLDYKHDSGDLRVIESSDGNNESNHEEGVSIIYDENIRRVFEEDQEKSFNINLNFETDTEPWHMNFSVYHSNVQFLLFFVASVLCLSADMYVQHLRSSLGSNTKMIYVNVIFISNCLLWLDFIVQSQAKRIKNSCLSGIIP